MNLTTRPVPLYERALEDLSPAHAIPDLSTARVAEYSPPHTPPAPLHQQGGRGVGEAYPNVEADSLKAVHSLDPVLTLPEPPQTPPPLH